MNFMAKDNPTLAMLKGSLAGLDFRKAGDRKVATKYVVYTGAIVFLFFLLGSWLFSEPGEAVDTTDTKVPSHSAPPALSEKEQLGEKQTPAEAEAQDGEDGDQPPDDGKQGSEDDGNQGSEGTELGKGVPSTNAADAGLDAEKEEQSTSSFATQQTVANEENTVGKGLKLCESSGWIPCLDNTKAIKALADTNLFEHRERHCPAPEEMPMCLVPLPEDYKIPIEWPMSKDVIWFSNVPDDFLATYKADQNWVVREGDKFRFPGGGTQFKSGVVPYIEFIENTVPDIAWGKHVRVALDIGCGVASWGAALLDKDVLTLSFAPADEHKAQIQLALERGVPAILEVMGAHRLPFSSNVFDLLHCSRCRVHWHKHDGRWLLDANRLLRPGGYFVWSATPVYQDTEEDKTAWEAFADLAHKMCWNLLAKELMETDDYTIGIAVFQKPFDNDCFAKRAEDATPVYCSEKDRPDAAWNVLSEPCLHKIPEGTNVRGSGGKEKSWPAEWPDRRDTAPDWLAGVEKGLFGNPGIEDYLKDTEHWKNVIQKSYLKGLGIDWRFVRNVMDMNAHYGGFAAALVDHPVWVMNVVPIHSLDTLPVIYDRGLIGVYHDWCEAFNTYPRTYDLVHADHLLSMEKVNCEPLIIMLEIDRILRPNGFIIVRETAEMMHQILPIANDLHYLEKLKYEDSGEGLLVLQKTKWRPGDE